MLIGCHWVCRMNWHPRDRQNRGVTNCVICRGPPDQEQQTRAGHEYVTLQVCLEGSKAEGEVGAMLLCMSNTKIQNVRHTRMEGPSGPRVDVRRYGRAGGKVGPKVDVRRYRQCRREGRIGSHLRAGVLMEMSTAVWREWTRNESRAVGDRPSSLWSTRMPET